MTKAELQLKVAELEREVELWRRFAVATHESRQLGPIVIVPESFDQSVLQDIQIVCK